MCGSGVECPELTDARCDEDEALPSLFPWEEVEVWVWPAPPPALDPDVGR